MGATLSPHNFVLMAGDPLGSGGILGNLRTEWCLDPALSRTVLWERLQTVAVCDLGVSLCVGLCRQVFGERWLYSLLLACACVAVSSDMECGASKRQRRL